MSEPALLPTSGITEPKTHIMHDVETWATQSSVPVLISLGAVKFTAEGVIERFHVRIDPKDCQRYGLEIEADTVEWWMDDKRQAARTQLDEMGKIDLYAALDGYQMWVASTPANELGSAWSMGATFDNVKLKTIYQKIGLEWPFGYRQEECYRTMVNRFKDVPFLRQGVHHGALDDAESQALHLIEIAKTHGIPL